MRRSQQKKVAMWFAALVTMALGMFAVTALVTLQPRDSRANQQAPAATTEPLVSETETTDDNHYVSIKLDPKAVVAAFNCARERKGLPKFKNAPALASAAQTMANALAKDGESHIHADSNEYTLNGQLLLNASTESEGCSVGGFDAEEMKDLEKASTIGVALVEVPNPYDQPMYIAVVLGR